MPSTAGAVTGPSRSWSPSDCWNACMSGALPLPPSFGSSPPGESLLGESLLGESLLGESLLGESLLGESLLGESLLGESLLGESELGESLLGESLLGEALLGESLGSQCGLFLTASPWLVQPGTLPLPFRVPSPSSRPHGSSRSALLPPAQPTPPPAWPWLLSGGGLHPAVGFPVMNPA